MANEFWMSDRQWAALEPLIPMGRSGVKPQRNRVVISGIVHVLKVGCRWRDCPEVYARTPRSTIGSTDGRRPGGAIIGAVPLVCCLADFNLVVLFVLLPTLLLIRPID
jgi:hypothetical protein